MIAPEFVDTVNEVLSEGAGVAPAVNEVELSVWELCTQGGILMIPLLILSLVCIYIFV